MRDFEAEIISDKLRLDLLKAEVAVLEMQIENKKSIIKSCPFCGSTANLIEISTNGIKEMTVQCSECHTHIPFSSNKDPYEAVMIWNKRLGGEK